MPFGSECCKGSKLYKAYHSKWNFKIANIAIKAFLRVRVYNDAIWFRMLQRLQITCGFVLKKLESPHRRTTDNGILKNCTVAHIAIKAFLRV